MKAKLLTDESLREDLYCEMMVTAGWLAYHNMDGGEVRDLIEKQLDYLMPVVKKHIKRHKRALKESIDLTSKPYRKEE